MSTMTMTSVAFGRGAVGGEVGRVRGPVNRPLNAIGGRGSDLTALKRFQTKMSPTLRGGCPPFSPPSPPPRPMRHSRPVTPSPTRPSPTSACRVRHDCTRRMRLQPFANDFRWGFLPNESPSAPLSPQVLSIRMRRHRRPRCALEGAPRLVCALRLRRSEELNPFDVGSFDGVATSQPHDPQEPQQWRD